MALTYPPPLTPHTPTDIFAALALSPGLSTPYPNSIPALHISPPSPPPHSPKVPPVPSFRPLTRAEAHQLLLLLHQYLHPHRSSPKGLMGESIRLSEELHRAGVRWDKRRRVMGLHVRGIWEEAFKIGGAGGEAGGKAADRYIQGSFLSIAEIPHPLDPMPLPLDLPQPHAHHPALPYLTLQAGLAQTLGAGVGVLPIRNGIRPISSDVGRGMEVDVPPTGNLSAFPLTAGLVIKRQGGKVGWRGKKKAGLRIKTGLPLDPTSRFAQIPNTALSTSIPLGRLATSSSLTEKILRRFVPGLKNGKSREKKGNSLAGIIINRPKNYMMSVGERSEDRQKDDMGQAVRYTKWEEVGVRTARKVSMGGWEVR